MQRSGRKGASLQALKQQATSLPAGSQGLKRQARINKLQDPSARVQAERPKLRGTSYKHIGILFMFRVEGNLVRGYLDFSGLCKF